MRHCPECRIDFTGVLDRCPLCGSALEGTPEGMTFPENELSRTKKVAKRCLIVLTLLGLLLTILAGLIADASLLAIFAGCTAVLITYIFIRNVVVHSPSVLRVVERYFLVLMGIALLYLLATGDTRIATFLIPVLTLIALFSNGVLVIVFRNAFVQGYAKYLLYDFVLGLVPLILMAFGLVTQRALSITSAVVALLLLLLMLVLTRKQLASEMQKLFHR